MIFVPDESEEVLDHFEYPRIVGASMEWIGPGSSDMERVTFYRVEGLWDRSYQAADFGAFVRDRHLPPAGMNVFISPAYLSVPAVAALSAELDMRPSYDGLSPQELCTLGFAIDHCGGAFMGRALDRFNWEKEASEKVGFWTLSGILDREHVPVLVVDNWDDGFHSEVLEVEVLVPSPELQDLNDLPAALFGLEKEKLVEEGAILGPVLAVSDPWEPIDRAGRDIPVGSLAHSHYSNRLLLYVPICQYFVN